MLINGEPKEVKQNFHPSNEDIKLKGKGEKKEISRSLPGAGGEENAGEVSAREGGDVWAYRGI